MTCLWAQSSATPLVYKELHPPVAPYSVLEAITMLQDHNLGFPVTTRNSQQVEQMAAQVCH
jgi:hypothetical protein